MLRNQIKTVISGMYPNGVEKIDYEVNAALYQELEAATSWDENGDLVLDGVKYRRICKNDYDLWSYWDNDYGYLSIYG